MAVRYDENRFKEWTRAGDRFSFQNLINDQRMLLYVVNGTMAAGTQYPNGGEPVNLLRGNAKTVQCVIITNWDGPGAHAHYDYDNSKLIVEGVDGNPIADNTPIATSTFQALVFARE